MLGNKWVSASCRCSTAKGWPGRHFSSGALVRMLVLTACTEIHLCSQLLDLRMLNMGT